MDKQARIPHLQGKKANATLFGQITSVYFGVWMPF
tara:strand:- start:17337 stop:17441 length:105 start_codon:yes stop_codon:yes gene_type:complete